MHFDYQGQTLTALLTNPRKTEPQRLDISSLLLLRTADRNKLLTTTRKRAIGMKYRTNFNTVQSVLRQFGLYLHWDNELHHDYECCLPTNFAEWQRLTLQFGLWYISRPATKASLETLCTVWQGQVRPWLEFLQDDGIIPLGVMLPDMRLPKEQGSHGSPQYPMLLGEKPARPTLDHEPVEKAPLDKTLAGPIFWHSDAEYLDEIEACLRQRDRILGNALDDYWLLLVRDFRRGQQLLRQVSVNEWQQRENIDNWEVAVTNHVNDSLGRSYKKTHQVTLTSPNNPDGYLWALRLMQQHLEHSDNPECLNLKSLRQHPAVLGRFLSCIKRTPVTPLLNSSALTPEQAALLSFEQLYHRFLGLLNTTDIAVAMALLIREHANLTPDSLAGAQLLNTRGKAFLLLADENQRFIFSVDKPRANSRKYAALTPRATRIMRHILRATTLTRALLKRANHPHWRYLFLGITQVRHSVNGLGHPPHIYSQWLYDTSDKGYKLTLARFYPSLIKVGLGAGTLNFSKIRHTQGVLAWFDEGSVRTVQKRLGNSNRVAIEHYIPLPLLNAWSERIIRRFQNTLLVLAAQDEDYLLDVVDMPTLAELHCFLAQLVHELPAGRSPIADKVQQHFGERFRIDRGRLLNALKAESDGLLHLRLSPNSMALLLAYRQWAKHHLSPATQNQPDTLTGLTPKHFIDLGDMLQAAAQNDSIGDKLRESLEVAKLQRAYSQAESKVPGLVSRLSQLSLNTLGKEDVE